MIVDDIWTSVGSTNLDNSSFRLNDEANLNVYDRAFASTQIADFEADRARTPRSRSRCGSTGHRDVRPIVQFVRFEEYLLMKTLLLML